jgi:hypothetical protein
MAALSTSLQTLFDDILSAAALVRLSRQPEKMTRQPGGKTCWTAAAA